MRRALIILIALVGIFLAIGCTGNQVKNQIGGGGANETGTPAQAVTEIQVVTGAQAVIPATEVTPAAALAGGINQTGNMTGNVTGNLTGMAGNVPGGMKPTLLYFTATWCGPCRTEKPILEELEKKYGDKVEFKVVDVDENQQLASYYGIHAIPTFIVLVEVKRFIGATNESVLASELDKVLYGCLNQTGNMTGNMTDNKTGMNGTVSGGMKPTLLYFTATWCGPCRMQKPILDELEKKYGDKVEFKVIDVDENQQLASKYGIHAIPTLIILRDSVEVKRFMGATNESVLASELNKTL